MGHKISPTSLRIDITENWKSRWFSRNKMAKTLKEDHEIREFINERYKKANVLRVDIERYADQIHIIIRTPRPGVLIGRGGTGVENLRKELQNHLGLKTPPRVTIPTEDMRSVANSARAIALNIAEQLERRRPYRRVSKKALDQAMQSGVKGAKISVSGRLNGADIARNEVFQKGKLPLHTLRADIDFARATAYTTYGTVGVKVWIYKGDVLDTGDTSKETKYVKHQQPGGGK